MIIKSCEITKLLRLLSYPELRLIFSDIYGNLEKECKTKRRRIKIEEVQKSGS
jgi:hypothetical protein